MYIPIVPSSGPDKDEFIWGIHKNEIKKCPSCAENSCYYIGVTPISVKCVNPNCRFYEPYKKSIEKEQLARFRENDKIKIIKGQYKFEKGTIVKIEKVMGINIVHLKLDDGDDLSLTGNWEESLQLI